VKIRKCCTGERRKTEAVEESMNPYVIFFSINDGYSFAVANVIMGLRRYSPSLLEKSDINYFP